MKIRVIGAKEARAAGLKTYFTGVACKHGHLAPRRTDNHRCEICGRASNRAYIKANPKSNRARKARQRLLNPEKCRELNRRYAAANREREAARTRCWRRDNPGRKLAEVKARKFAKKQRTPVWADRKKITDIYIKCRRLNDLGANQYHVDHVIPLFGKLVCGLHVENNLQILTASENLKKGCIVDEN